MSFEDAGFDFDASVQAPFRMQPGLRKLEPGAAQLTPLAPGGKHQREKLAVLSAFADQAMLAEPGFDAGPALQALCSQAAAEHPLHWTWDGRTATAPRLGVAVHAGEVRALGSGVFGSGDEVPRCIAAQPPVWRLPALLALSFAEDLALVDGATGRVPWLAVCLPSHWAPEQKIGRSFVAIHAPVADGELLRSAGPALMKLVCAGERWERFVWTITDHPRLHAHPARVGHERWAAQCPGAAAVLPPAWFRSERQTFIPVPAAGQAVFTIRIDVQPLAEVLAEPARALRLAAAIESMSQAVLDYRGLRAVRGPLLAALRAAGGT